MLFRMKLYFQQGKKFCFISNIDNLGATVDLSILRDCLSQDHEFIMEVSLSGS